jgi:nucleotidyltransferase/DNA polymerase involved in DNA repair
MVIAALAIPRFAYVVVARRLGLRDPRTPAALAPEPGGPPRVGEPSAAASAAGVRAGMRLSEALALCPQLALLPPDPVAVEEATELLYDRLEDLGLPLEPAGPGRALLATDPVERLYGGRAAVLMRLQDTAPGGRIGAAPGRFPALAATRRARTGRPVSVTPPAVREFLAPLAIESLVEDGEVDPALVEALRRLGIDRLGRLEAIGRLQVRDRFGPAGEHAWRLASGDDRTPLRPRPVPEAMRETLVLPDAAVTEGTLDHALRVLVERLLERPDRRGREPRTLRLGARLVGGGSWSVTAPLREPTADAGRIRLALQAKLQALPAPAEELTVEIARLAPGNRQVPLFREDGEARAARLASAVGQVRAALGESAALHVVAVDEASRLPERRFGLAPR